MAAFPTEIVEVFLFHLDSGKTKETNLISCAQVSQTWRSIAQRLLFFEVKITAGSDKANAFAIAITAAGSSHLPELVNKLTFEIDDWTNPPAQTTLDILRTLVHLRDLNFAKNLDTPQFFPNANDDKDDWHPDLVSALQMTLSSPYLTNLRLFSFNLFPLSIFVHCTALEHLIIDHCTFTGMDDVITPPNPKPKIQSFWFATTVSRPAELQLLEWLMKPHALLDMSGMQQFFVSNTSDQDKAYEIVCRFIASISPSLKHLLTGPSWEVPAILFPAARLVKLTTLDVSILPRNEKNAVSWAGEVLSNLAEPSLLEELTIQYRAPRASHIKEFQPLDSCLASGGFKNLKELLVMLYITPEQNEAELVSAMKASFPTFEKTCLRVHPYQTSGPLLA